MSLTAGESSENREVVKVILRYRKVGSDQTITNEQIFGIPVVAQAGMLVASAYHKFLIVRGHEVRSEARAMADRGQFEGAAAAMRQMMQTIEKAPEFVQGSGSPLAELYEILLDEVTAMERKPKQEEYQSFRDLQGVTMSISPSDLSRISAKSKTSTTHFFVASLAGKFPKAFLEVIGGEDDGKHFALKAHQIIGRTESADIQLKSSSVSRQHAQIFAKEGKFYIVDCGSMNTTKVNGARILDAHKLVRGDMIELGKLQLRYGEE
jgi:hypothetical protein